MTNYTPDDFRTAQFATRRGRYTACRSASGLWRTESGTPLTDSEMAERGWSPVREHAPVSLDTLREAWENAEVPTEDTPIRTDDALIFPLFAGYCVRLSWGDSTLTEARILRRVPRREPWQALADLIGWYDGDTDDPSSLARFLHEHEVTTPADHEQGVGGGTTHDRRRTMNEYTPSEATVISAYVDWSVRETEVSAAEAGWEFDRFIAKVKADALREVADEYATSNREQSHGVTSVLMFMHHRANRIEQEDER